MRAFRDVLRFELRLHLTSPLFWGVAFLFFALHLLTITEVGLNISDNDRQAINSAWSIFQTELILGVFGMLPAIVFPVGAITRDSERQTTELFFTTPVPRAAFLLGRFSAGTLAACLVGAAGVVGAVSGTFMPWVDPTRVMPFDWRPWTASIAIIVLPNMLVFSAVFFSVAALTRSTALTLGAAAFVLAIEVLVNVSHVPPVPGWLLLADPFGALPVAEAARFWTVSELNTRLPVGLLWPNRLLWMAVASATLFLLLWRYRLELPVASGTPGRRVLAALARVLAFGGHPAVAVPRAVTVSSVRDLPTPLPFDRRVWLRQLRSQVRMDWRAAWRDPLFWLMLALGALSIGIEARNLRSPLGNLPLYPATSLILDVIAPGLSQFLLLSIVYFSAVLVWRERGHAVSGISDALPVGDWLPVVSKTVVVCAVVLSQLAVAMVVILGIQETADFHDHAIGTLLQGIFIYNGVYFLMLCVCGVFVQVLSPGKWSGMVLGLLVIVLMLALPELGFGHLLYGLRFPTVRHSDMNGFGQYAAQTYAMSAYRLAACALVLAAGLLLYQRGYRSSWRERLLDARVRLTGPVRVFIATAATAGVGAGAVIFYNTNVLNRYLSTTGEEALQAQYERDYGRYRDTPAPSIVDPDVEVEIFARERRLVSRGSAGLRNTKTRSMGDFVISVDRRNRVDELTVDGASLVTADREQGFYLFHPLVSLEPGRSLRMKWSLSRENRGFPNAAADTELVGNGSYLGGTHMPIPGYCRDCELETNRARYGLPAQPRLPALGDPAHLDDLRFGADSRTSFRMTVGTDEDQTAVVPGELRRTWQANGRRYFEYALAGPVWPLLTVQSARYQVGRDRWNDVGLEVFYDARHAWNVRTMLETAKKGLELYSREFAPYTLSYYRIAEYARYRSNVQAGVGTIAYSEGSGFLTDLRGWADLDYATLHELAHQWWGNVYGARMQGRQLLNEGLAQYSTLLAYRTYAPPVFARRLMAGLHDGYLDARGNETRAEQPVLLTEDQGYISYNKAPLALFALDAVIGADAVNGALRAYYARFVDRDLPLPTSRDLVDELRRAAGPQYDALITDLFEKITLYDVGIKSAEVRRDDHGYAITIDVVGRQLEAVGNGDEREVPLDTWFQLAVFPRSDRDVAELEPLYLRLHKLHTGEQRVTVHVSEAPGRIGIDPFHLMIDRKRDDNLVRLSDH